MNDTEKPELPARVARDVGGTLTVALAYIGDRLDLFKGLARGPAGSHELAERLSLNERYVREWLKAMVASEYVEFDGERYFMNDEQRAAFADEGGMGFLGGSFQLAGATVQKLPGVIEAFRNGGGVPFAELGPEVAEGIDRLHRPAFDHLLVQEWLPQVPDLEPRLTRGAHVLDVGCGLGRSARAIAAAYPRSRVTALEPDSWSMRRARELCAGLDNVEFAETTLEGLDSTRRYDFALAFDCIHDMVDPVAELRRIRQCMADDGLFVWVEPTGSTDPRENRNPVDRMRACISPLHCLTVSLARDGAGLGTIIGEHGARDLARRAEYGRFRKLPIEHPQQQFFLLQR
ncbi:MAG: methyltransferase domain-containing protein [bacterium]|nr:methyltransferase domain-containing protein [bacterium]